MMGKQLANFGYTITAPSCSALIIIYIYIVFILQAAPSHFCIITSIQLIGQLMKQLILSNIAIKVINYNINGINDRSILIYNRPLMSASFHIIGHLIGRKKAS